MVVLFNLATLALLGYVGYGLYILHQWSTSAPRQLARQASKLAKEASTAARQGNYAERDRLDDARNAILTGLAGQKWEFKGTDHDDFMDKFLR